jgi:nucleotide-binding universal stress UspA family protein
MFTLRRIVCPVDFSDLSQVGLRHAVWLGAWSKAELDVVHVASRGSAVPPAEARSRLRRWVDGVTSLEVSTRGVYARVHVAWGEVTAAILDYAAERECDVIVMATHGRTGFERLAQGSFAEAVLRLARCPVLTVNPAFAASVVSRPAYRRILVPLELAAPARHALSHAFALAEAAGATVVVLHLLDKAPASEGPDPSVRAPMDALWTTVPLRARRETLPPVVVRAKPEDEILSAAATAEADLIVMGVHGRNALATMVFGSTANGVVRRSACPVLTVRATPHRRTRKASVSTSTL